MTTNDPKIRPDWLNAENVIAAVAVHVVFFLCIWWFASAKAAPEETVIPIDLTVVVNENLNGVEDEPPPTRVDPPPPPKVEPPKPPPPPPPPPVEVKPADAVEVVQKPPEKPKPPKVEPPKPPKKTPEQIKREREEMLRRMRESAKPLPTPKPQPKTYSTPATPPTIDLSKFNLPSGNGRTDRRTMSPEELARMLRAGYRPGAANQIANSELQLCLSLIKTAFYEKWTDRPAWTADLRKMQLEVRFGVGGRVMGYRMVQSSGDVAADNTVLRAASRVHTIPGLSVDFLKSHSTVTVEFEVKPN